MVIFALLAICTRDSEQIDDANASLCLAWPLQPRRRALHATACRTAHIAAQCGKISESRTSMGVGNEHNRGNNQQPKRRECDESSTRRFRSPNHNTNKNTQHGKRADHDPEKILRVRHEKTPLAADNVRTLYHF